MAGQNDLYDFPSVNICFQDGFGCEEDDDNGYDDCVDSVGSSVYYLDEEVLNGEDSSDNAHTSTQVRVGDPTS